MESRSSDFSGFHFIQGKGTGTLLKIIHIHFIQGKGTGALLKIKHLLKILDYTIAGLACGAHKPNYTALPNRGTICFQADFILFVFLVS